MNGVGVTMTDGVRYAVEKALSKIYLGRRKSGVVGKSKEWQIGIASFVLGKPKEEVTDADLAMLRGLQEYAPIWERNASSDYAEQKWYSKTRYAFSSGKWFNKYLEWAKGRGAMPTAPAGGVTMSPTGTYGGRVVFRRL